MSINEKHPSYLEREADWTLLSHCFAGERAIKAEGATYLPPTGGMIANGYGRSSVNGRAPVGQAAYDAYRTRAVFHDFLRETISGLLGVIHRKPPVFEVPKALEPMLENATIAGESMRLLWRRITEAQLKHGRCGLLVDVPDGAKIGDAMPYVALYSAPTVINWDVGQRVQGRQVVELVVLDESAFERKGDLTWQYENQARVLTLSHALGKLGVADQAEVGAGQYVVAVVRYGQEGGTDLSPSSFVTPSVGAVTLDRIPFVFVNANDTVAEPDVPPFLGLANLSMAVYRGEADYRQSLFMQGQDTLVRIGVTEDQAQAMTGVGAIVDVPMGGDAKFIGVSSSGLSEQRQALENDKAQALQTAVRSLDMRGHQAESGEALRVRVSAKTATLASLQLTAAAAIKEVLQIAGRWMSVSDAELEAIQVVPNLDFSDAKIDAQGVNQLVDAVVKGAPLSWQSVHQWLRDNEYTDLSWDDEQERIRAEITDGLRADPAAPIADVDPFAGDQGFPQ